MNDKEYVTLICPYCGTRQKRYLERIGAPQVILCDCENAPGCDRYFAVKLEIVHKLEYFAVNETPQHEDCTKQRLAEAIADCKKHQTPHNLPGGITWTIANSS